jgi:hypothetical protein
MPPNWPAAQGRSLAPRPAACADLIAATAWLLVGDANLLLRLAVLLGAIALHTAVVLLWNTDPDDWRTMKPLRDRIRRRSGKTKGHRDE